MSPLIFYTLFVLRVFWLLYSSFRVCFVRLEFSRQFSLLVLTDYAVKYEKDFCKFGLKKWDTLM